MNKYKKMKVIGWILFAFGWFCPFPLMTEGYIQIFWMLITLVILFTGGIFIKISKKNLEGDTKEWKKR